MEEQTSIPSHSEKFEVMSARRFCMGLGLGVIETRSPVRELHRALSMSLVAQFFHDVLHSPFDRKHCRCAS